VGVILGLKHTRTGDTLVSSRSGTLTDSLLLQNIVPPAAVMSASIIPQSYSDLDPVQEALQSLVRTDPSVRVDTQEGQILVHGLGALHLEIVEGRLRDEWNIRFELGRRRVSYREGLGPGEPTARSGGWQTDVSGKSIIVTVTLLVRAMQEHERPDPTWDGNLVLGPNGKQLPLLEAYTSEPLAHITRGISSALSTSPNTSLGMSHLCIQVKSFDYPSDVPATVLAGAAASVLRDRIREAGTGPLMEPYIRLKISVNEDSLGKVVKDLTENGGEIQALTSGESVATDEEEYAGPYSHDGVYIGPNWLSPSSALVASGTSPRFKQIINAIAPLSKMLDYSTRLRALSGGHGLFEMVNAGFREVSEARKLEILKELGRV
jgi:elongation factor G